VGHGGGSHWESQPNPHCRRTSSADGAPAPCSLGEHGARSCCCGRSGDRRSAGEHCTRCCYCRRGSVRRGARGGAHRGWTGGHRQHPRHPDRDGGPVKLVSVKSSRVVLDVVVVLDLQPACVLCMKSTVCPGRGMNPLQRWRKKKPHHPPRSPLSPLMRSPKRRLLRLRCLKPA
jgi:hypothetical protein